MYSANTNNQISTIFLNSNNAKISNGSFEFDLETPIKCRLSENIILSLIEFQTANNFPIFTSYNNFFSYRINDPITNVQLFAREVTIPSTVMNPVDFCILVNADYIAYRPAIYTHLEFSVHFNKQTFILEFSSNTHFDIISTTASKELGLPGPFPIASAYVPAYNIRELPVSFIASKNIFIKTQEFTLNNINSLGQITNTFARVPVNTNPGYTIFYRPVETNRFLIPTKTIKKLSMTFEKDNNTLIENIDFQMMLKIEFVYPQEREESYEAGTINYYFKNNPTMPEEEEEEDEPFGV